jgi:hypothetical protein
VLFHRYCGACHDTADRFPPNFLQGSPAEVEKRLAQCGPRIAFRLSMWSRAPSEREKTPMPPLSALPGLGLSDEEWRSHGDLAALRDLATGDGRAGAMAAVSGNGPYEGLAPCLEP